MFGDEFQKAFISNLYWDFEGALYDRIYRSIPEEALRLYGTKFRTNPDYREALSH